MRQTALRKLRVILERTLIRAEADALDATSATAEQMSLRKALSDTERGCESGGRLIGQPNRVF